LISAPRGDRASARLLLLGVSVRALAASAVRSPHASRRFPDGFLALDYFGDADLLSLASGHPIRVLCLSRDLDRPRSVETLARSALDLEWQALVYSGGLENRPDLLRRLENRGAVLGNGPDVVEAVRDPTVFFPFLRRAGIPHPLTFAGGRDRAPVNGPPCLWKPIRSGGGIRVRLAQPRRPRPRGFYLQQYLRGTPGSASFVSASGRAVLLGVTEQLAGFRDLGASGFRYGGNIAGPPHRILSRQALAVLAKAASAITRRFGLRGLMGLDFILSGGVPHIIEINPRYTASMELFEDASDKGLLDVHLEALERGRLPSGPFPVRRFLAKGILYATRAVRWASSLTLAGLDVRDRPAEGEPIEIGHPICTLVVGGASPEECRRRLAEGAGLVRRTLRVATRNAPRARRRRTFAASAGARRSVLR